MLTGTWVFFSQYALRFNKKKKKKTIDDLILSKPSVCFYIRWWESNMV